MSGVNRVEDSYLKLISVEKRRVAYHCSLCGKDYIVVKKYSQSNMPKSCGCICKLKPQGKDYTGDTVNGCLVIGYAHDGLWKVKYPCGCEYFKHLYEIRNRVSVVCNKCREHISPTLQHGHKRRGSHDRTYNSWLNLRRRCYDKSNNRYTFYGENGIVVCDEWNESFEKFLSDMGECPVGYSIERINVTKGYCKANCKWADDITQANNKTNNILISNGEEVMSLRHWCIVEGVDYKAAHYRLKVKKDTIGDILGSGYRLSVNKFDV